METEGPVLAQLETVVRSRCHEEIEQKDAQLNGFFVNAPVGLAIIGNDFRFQRINGPFSKLNGRPPEVNTGLYVRDVTSNLATELEPEKTRFSSSSHQVSEEKRKGRDYEQSDGS